MSTAAQYGSNYGKVPTPNPNQLTPKSSINPNFLASDNAYITAMQGQGQKYQLGSYTGAASIWAGMYHPSGPVPQGKTFTWSDGYIYNAPMVKESYFGFSSFENTILEGNLVDQGKYTDARNAWKGGFTGGRGTIQMDDKFLNAYKNSLKGKPLSSSFDTKKYGFKFLYNPTTVSMAWGLIQEMDPIYESMGQDPFQVISTSLMTSTVSFELMLNRIHDFKYIDENGFMGKRPEDVYPDSVTPEEAALIYQKGTMYDLEYFFKTVNGPDATFTSDLNGTTADKAWLRPTIVELHLGDGMRYRVRIGEFAVNHLIFNPRMVPILSTVRLTCNRFIDGPEVASSAALGKLNLTGK